MCWFKIICYTLTPIVLTMVLKTGPMREPERGMVPVSLVWSVVESVTS